MSDSVDSYHGGASEGGGVPASVMGGGTGAGQPVASATRQKTKEERRRWVMVLVRREPGL